MNYLWIDENNRNAFKSVLPKAYATGHEKVCFGAYDDDGFVCGALCYRYANYQYDILWIYVEEEKRRQGVATGLLDLLFRIVGKSGEIYPVSALFEPSLEESLYGFFIAYSKMETAYSHDRFYVLPREIRGIKFPDRARRIRCRRRIFSSSRKRPRRRFCISWKSNAIMSCRILRNGRKPQRPSFAG